ncbi:MAG: hypothetical protein IJ205_01705 [Bacteroidales bacterium]|nr:hypothetical protein [Bacteroidales bacterium]
MNRESFSLSLLLVVSGLFFGLSLSAQQYHDAAAFGLKGHVKECRIFNTGDGSETYDVHDFSFIAFTNEGKLDQWVSTPTDKTNRVRHIKRTDRSDGRLNGIVFSDDEEYRFRYKGDDLIGFYDKYSEYDPFWGNMENTEVITFHDDGKESFTTAFFETDFVSETLDSLIENGFDSGKDFFPSLEKYLNSFYFIINDYNSNTTNYIVRGRDSHGNYTALYDPDTGESVKRVITYWDDEPASAKPTQAPKKTETPKKTEAPKATETAKEVVQKELSPSDIVTRPFGVLPADRWRCSMDQILSDLSKYGWKTKTDNKLLSSNTIELDNLQDKSGYDLSVLGTVPFSVTAWFRESGKELSSMWYYFPAKNHKEALQFCGRLISFLRSGGVDFPESSNNATEVSAKYGKSIVRVKFPGKGSTASLLQIDYWSSYRSSDGKWVTGWVE